MQVINSLITHRIFHKKEYRALMDLAEELTLGNQEYYIYTLANKSYSNLSINRIDDATAYMEKSLSLSLEGNNYLSIKQCLDDWDILCEKYGTNEINSKEVFPRYYSFLEKRLLPNLYHWESIFSYFQ